MIRGAGRQRGRASVVLLLLTGVPASPALGVELQDRLSVSLGVSDNLTWTSADKDSDMERARLHSFTTVSNALTGSFESKRGEHMLSHNLSATRRVATEAGVALSNTLSLSNQFELKRAVLSLGGTATHSRFEDQDLATLLSNNPEPRAPGSPSYLMATLRQGLSLELGGKWRISQSFSPNWYFPLSDDARDDLRRYSGFASGASVGREWGATSVRAETSLGFRRLFELSTGENPGNPDDDYTIVHPSQFGQAQIVVAREVGDALLGEAGAGIITLRQDFTSAPSLDYSLHGSLRWTVPDWGDGSLSYQRSVVGGVTVAALYLTDAVRGSGTLLLGKRDQFRLTAGAS